MKDVKLKPCPFCGGEVKHFRYSWGVCGVVHCQVCKTKFVLPWGECTTDMDLYNAWNRRATNGNED